jgi:hypothetical protein
MDASISKSESSSSATINEKNRNANKQRSSAPATSLASSLASASISCERRSTSQGRRGIKTTTFDQVFIYEFPLTLGDNPAVREGCPIALGNECVHKTVLDMESFEQSRRLGIQKRRWGEDLYIPVYHRAALLMSRGFTLEKIVQTVLEVEKVKKSRQESMKLNGWQKLNYAIDSAGKSIIRKFTNGNSSRNKWNNNKNNNDNIKGGRDQKRGNVVQAARMA